LGDVVEGTIDRHQAGHQRADYESPGRRQQTRNRGACVGRYRDSGNDECESLRVHGVLLLVGFVRSVSAVGVSLR